MLKFIFLLLLSLATSKDPSLPEHTLPVYGNASLGYYYVDLFVGHPPQQQSVIIDTGSGQLALPCNKCTNCNPKHIDTPFDMSKSKTAEYLTCVNFILNSVIEWSSMQKMLFEKPHLILQIFNFLCRRKFSLRYHCEGFSSVWIFFRWRRNCDFFWMYHQINKFISQARSEWNFWSCPLKNLKHALGPVF